MNKNNGESYFLKKKRQIFSKNALLRGILMAIVFLNKQMKVFD